MSDHFDLLVIGAGPAGEKGAAQAAYFGKRVCLVERAPKPGGAAVNTGTIPSKTLRETALFFSGLKQRGLYGVEYHIKPDITISDFMYRERAVIESEWQLINENLARHQITTVQGTAKLLDAHTIEVTRYKDQPRRLTADFILLATGSHPLRPATISFDGEVVVDSDSLLTLTEIPGRLIVIGGGVIGCEYASIFAALGVRVTIVNARERLLTQLDAEVSEALRAEMTRRLGVQVLLNASPQDVLVEGDDRKFATVTLTDGTHLVGDCVLCCVGREGSTRGLGLEDVGVRVNPCGFVLVDDRFRTTVPSVFAAGDVVGFPALASTSMEQARVAMCHAFDLKFKEQVSPVLPYGVWTVPEIAMVGETEESARGKGLRYEIGKSSFRLNARGQIIGDLDGFVKLIFRRDDKMLLGCSILGENACEMIHVAAAVMSFGGSLDYFIHGVFNYPTLSEAYKYAAYDGLQRLAKRVSQSAGLPAVTAVAP
ncbi:MAG TPA: Si-specific NAD(P)(+) transhydrogenase [Gemmatimonadaceae bacterium]|nr:Si-specific NAD(P)(+) transhydrogenase [Gemmatimonadaceae bacterium]